MFSLERLVNFEDFCGRFVLIRGSRFSAFFKTETTKQHKNYEIDRGL